MRYRHVPLGCILPLILCAFNAIGESVQWVLVEETHIDENVRGSIKRGHIFVTATGNIYEVNQYTFLYEYALKPSVMVLSSGPQYRLIIQGFSEPLLCKRLNKKPITEDIVDVLKNLEELIVRRAQQALKILGHNPGTIGGELTFKTKAAISEFCKSSDIADRDTIDSLLLGSLAKKLGEKTSKELSTLNLAIELYELSTKWMNVELSKSAGVPLSPSVLIIQSEIDNDCQELREGAVFRLINGQYWKQTDFASEFGISIRPKVHIWPEAGLYRMKVEGFRQIVSVRQLE